MAGKGEPVIVAGHESKQVRLPESDFVGNCAHQRRSTHEKGGMERPALAQTVSALFTNNGAGISLTARDWHGTLVLAAGSGIMLWDPSQVKLEALLSLRRFLTPAMLEAKDIIIEGDCKNVIDFCRRTLQRSTWSTPTIMEQELAFLAELNNVMVRHIPREANRLADYCAKYDMYNTFVWTDRMLAPPEFLEILQADLDGMPNV
ncbi:hypothetical protein KSP39_PZI021910 [Platanthera zijinensis]|uniref:RNase H type-1 domain-containing protein n=1 Tax=Platanthera zijinensis TaxID=2320716 RepID=A0AAP0FW41_9ASPA